MKKVIIGSFWLNEQDPFEPTGVMFETKGQSNDLAKVLEQEFGVIKDDEENPPIKKKLKITIEEE